LSVENIKKHLSTLADPKQAQQLQRYFKTGEGQYGQGDLFLGIRVPQLRKLAKQFQLLTIIETSILLRSDIHEERLTALLILITKFSKGEYKEKKQIYELYIKNTEFINNWDLVDISAPHLVGNFLMEKNREMLFILVNSKNLWERRISIMATFYFIKNNDFSDSLKIAKALLDDAEDLIHKAVGWMLREIGKKNLKVEELFLKKHYKTMPRTMLRSAIERLPEDKRKKYLLGKV